MVRRYSYYPAREDKILVAKSVIDAFPNLKSNTKWPYDLWFDPNDATKGYLATKLNTMRRSLPPDQLQRPRTKTDQKPQKTPQKAGNSKSKTPKRTHAHLEEIPQVEEEELILFCKRASIDNRKQILQAMEQSFQNRRNWIMEEYPTVGEILARYPRFQDFPTALQQEFHLLFPDAAARLISTWETRFSPFILKVGELSRLPKLQTLMDENKKTKDAHNGTPDALFAYKVLIYLLPSHAGKKSSISDALSYFMVTRPNGTAVASFLVEKTDQKRTQPYLLRIGDGFTSPSTFFIIVDGKAVPCESDATQAVDALFKSHYIFNIEYADELKGFYAFLEHFVYGIGVSTDHIPVRARELMASITALARTQSH
ncbi:uncharacterized protein LOC121417400 [Lytechinus variegatus]|uniref:uncharacterized protein LOC121417400 n=1 Tax=Lytechinus variegatus TaxID=7654 RepID=UPI001BB1FCC6|nr:uncharacterized protein LOC121417400 [Lytechinus variegatus]